MKLTLFLCLLSAVCAYFLGSVNTSMLVSAFMGKDVRTEGSGNAGATNTLRVFGKGAAAIVVLGDAAKGVLAILIARLALSLSGFGGDYMHPAVYAAGLCVVLGHNFPLYFGFKGGKGIMTSAAVILMLDWKIGIVVVLFALAVMAITKYVSLGSCLACVLFPVLVIIFHRSDVWFIVTAVAMGALAIFMHRANIARLISGTESKLSFKK